MKNRLLLFGLLSSWQVAIADEYDFSGITFVDGCSASLVQFDDSKSTDMAIMLINGHCVSLNIPEGKAIFNGAYNRRVTFLDSQANEIGETITKKMLYATTTVSDLAVYQLGLNYQQIFNKFRVKPLVLSRKIAPVGTKIQILSGFWKTGYSCQIDKLVYKLREGFTLFDRSIRYSEPGCEIIGGTSGAPIIENTTRMVVGINSTGNEDGQRCTNGNPCEISENGSVFYRQGLNYGHQVHWLYDCRNSKGLLDFTLMSCKLPKKIYAENFN